MPTATHHRPDAVYLDSPEDLRETEELAERLSARLVRHALFAQAEEVDETVALLGKLIARRS